MDKLSLYRARQAVRGPGRWNSQHFLTIGTWKWQNFHPYALAAFTYFMYHQLDIQNFCVLPTVQLRFVWIWEQTATISLHSINWLVFIRETVFTARYGLILRVMYIKTFKAQWSLYVTSSLTFNNSTFCPHRVFMCFVWISEQTAIISLHSINVLVFTTEAESVYCAVRTGSSNQIVSSLKG